MRGEDFSRSYVLNVTIVDCLFADPMLYGMQTKSLLNFIAADFGGCEVFLSSYYARGKAVSALISGLAGAWPGFVSAAVNSPANLMHVARIIGHLSNAHLKSLIDAHPALSDFASQRLADILAQGVDFPAERLKSISLEATNLVFRV